MSENVAQINPEVRFRLSPAQIAVIALGMDLITGSYQTRLRKGTSPYSYPFRIYPPPRGFNRGTFNLLFMEKLLALGKGLTTRTKAASLLNDAKVCDEATGASFCTTVDNSPIRVATASEFFRH
jgi:hypothetical protein